MDGVRIRIEGRAASGACREEPLEVGVLSVGRVREESEDFEVGPLGEGRRRDVILFL